MWRPVGQEVLLFCIKSECLLNLSSACEGSSVCRQNVQTQKDTGRHGVFIFLLLLLFSQQYKRISHNAPQQHPFLKPSLPLKLPLSSSPPANDTRLCLRLQSSSCAHSDITVTSSGTWCFKSEFVTFSGLQDVFTGCLNVCVSSGFINRPCD